MITENHQKKWTPELDDMLYEWVSANRSYNYMAKELGRSPISIERRIIRLGIEDKHLMTGTLSAKGLAEIVHVDPKTVIDWIKKQGLPAVQKTFRYRQDRKHKPYYINPEDFWVWAGERKHKIIFSKIERGLLLPEPDWLREEIRKEYQNPLAKQKKPWTEEEDEKLWTMYYRRGMLQKNIAIELKRTKDSVERRLSRLRKQRL